jgi:hypothetical protein
MISLSTVFLSQPNEIRATFVLANILPLLVYYITMVVALKAAKVVERPPQAITSASYFKAASGGGL